MKTHLTILAVLITAGLTTASAQAPPPNDEVTGATVISSLPFTDNVNTTLATNNPADPVLSCNAGGNFSDGNTVWYVWTPPEDVSVTISTLGSTESGGVDPLDTAHGVFTGTVGDLTEVACVDVGLNDRLLFEATGGATYYIKFGEFEDGVGGGNLVVDVTGAQVVLESLSGLSDPISTLVAGPALTERAAETVTTSDFVETSLFLRDEFDKDAVAPVSGVTTGALQLTEYDTQIEVLQIFDGVENNDNAFQLGLLLAPPDTDGDVGINHYVQMTNLVTMIFDKSGNTVLGPFGNNVFWTGLGGLCETFNRGDPIVLYDEENDRWFVSQFAFTQGFGQTALCIALSTTGDPTGSYYQHEFDFSGIGLPDYPKFGFATDAIGVMANLFVPFQGAALGAIDKAEAYSALPATMVLFRLGTNEFGFVVGDNDGPVFNNMLPTFATNNGFSGSTIDFWEIQPDFVTPANSTVGEVASIPVAPFDTDLCVAFRERCIDQPGSGTGGFPNNVTFLESITDRLMHRLQLRDYGDYKEAVVTHTVDADGNGKAGKRWYEFRNRSNRGWRLFKQSTFSPDGDHRWMGSIASNSLGETLLGYSISSTTTYPSIGVAGRRGKSDEMNKGELVVFDGNVDQHVQRRTSRWGDYSAMAIDPVDGTFWYTQEYAKPNSFIGEQFGWATKIAQLRLMGGPSAKVTDDNAQQEEAVEVPREYALAQNYPNPFNPATMFTVAVPKESDVRLAIYDVLGREVEVLLQGTMSAGEHSVAFHASDRPSGIYIARLDTPRGTFVRKMQLVK